MIRINRQDSTVRRVHRFGIAAATLALAGLLGSSASAIVHPLAFEEVVAGAETIFLGRFADSRAFWEESQSGRLIVTRVVFAVERVYKGPPMIQTSLDLLGGTIGDMTMRVEGVPTFHRGDRDVLFVRPTTRALNSLVGGESGRFRVERDERGQDAIRPLNSIPLPRLLGFRQPQATGPTGAMSLQELEVSIAQALKRGQP